MICGPALGGLIYAFSPIAVYVLCTSFFMSALLLMIAIRAGLAVGERKPLTFESLFAGVGFIRNRRVLFGIISLDLFAVLLGGATALLPIFAKDILGTGPWGLGFLRSAPAIGALAASVILTRYQITQSLGRVMFACVALFGAATVVFGLSTSFPLSLAGPGGAGGGRRHQRRHPFRAGAGGNAERDAGPRQRDQLAVHRDVEYAR